MQDVSNVSVKNYQTNLANKKVNPLLWKCLLPQVGFGNKTMTDSLVAVILF